MKIRFSLLVALFALALPTAAAQAAKPYYVSLGDSLAVGVQPTAKNGKKGNANTRDGYTFQLAKLRGGVRHVALGCGGATTESLMNGGKPCSPKRKPGYKNKSKKTSQLAAAEKFLREHRGDVAFVTIDIGANDVASCAQGGSIDYACLNKGLAALKKNTPKIAKRLRKAAGRKVPMAAITLYDPFLQQWFNGDAGKTLAKLSVTIAKEQVNAVLIKAFRAQRFRIADVAKAFDTYVPFERTTTYRGQAGVPVAVARICRLTWMCAPAPKGPDIHANKAGYTLIAKTLRKALR